MKRIYKLLNPVWVYDIGQHTTDLKKLIADLVTCCIFKDIYFEQVHELLF